MMRVIQIYYVDTPDMMIVMKKLYLILLLFLYPLVCVAHPTVVFTSVNSSVVGNEEFSVSETKTVVFAKGNLMYQPSTKTWRIAPRQFDFVGGNNTKDIPLGRQGTIWENGVQCDGTSRNHVRNYTGWLDVFNWGTSGWYGDDPGEDDTKTYTWRLANNPNRKVTCNPYDVGHKDSLCLILGGDEYQGFTGDYAFADWGIRNNAILGGTGDSLFRTPTKDEFDYLLTERTNAKELSIRGHIRLTGVGSAPDTIINGLILLPDEWDPFVLPEKDIVSDADGNEYYETNEFTIGEWNVLEANGAIFLPATGNTSKFNRSGFYWTSTSWKNTSAYNVEFGGYGWKGHASDPQTKAADKSSGRAVRLVMEVTTTTMTPIYHEVATSCSSYEKLDAPGTDGYIVATRDDVDECIWKLNAIPESDYQFAYWIDLHGKKRYIDSTNITIDTEMQHIVMQAVFVNSDAHMYGFEGDSIVFRSASTDVLGGKTLGYSELVSGGSVVRGSLQAADNGVWKQKLTQDLKSNTHAGEKLHVVLYDNTNRPTAVVDTIVPVIIAGDSLASNVRFPDADVHILEGGTLTINTNTVINGYIDIHEDGKLVINNGVTLTVDGIIMHGNGIEKKWAQLIANGNIQNRNSDTIYYDYTLDYFEYYPLALPYDVKCSDVHNPVNSGVASYQAYYYDSEIRALGSSAWMMFDDTQPGEMFVAGKGYSIYAVPMNWNGRRQKAAIVRFPMVADLTGGEHEKAVPVYSNGVGEPVDRNWNLIGNPYLADFAVDATSDTSKLVHGYYEWNGTEYEIHPDGSELRYVTYSEDGFRTYNQERLKGFVMKPFNSYFVQTVEGDALSFVLSDRRQYAPSRVPRTTRDIELGILITDNSTSDCAGIMFGEYTSDYELNADLLKEFGDNSRLSLYFTHGGIQHSFLALPSDMISNPVSVGVKNSKSNDLVFSLTDTSGDVEGVWLFDSNENTYTDLMKADYAFAKSSNDGGGRFYLTVVKKQEDVPTGTNTVLPAHEGVSYDVLGRRTDAKNPGVYIISVGGKYKKEVILR